MTNTLDLNIATHALDLAPFGVCITGPNDKLIYGNRTLLTIFNLNNDQVQAGQSTPSRIADALEKNEPYFEIPVEHNEGSRTIKFWAHAANRQNGTNIYFFLDVTDKKALYAEKSLLEDELSRLNTRDSLTGLPNKFTLLQVLEPLVSRSRRYNNPLTVVHLEVMTPTTDAQDETIVTLSHMLRDQMRWADIVGRLDTDKFLLVLPETPEEAAATLVDKLTTRINELISSKRLAVKAYFGIASWSAGDDARLMLKRAAQKAAELRRASAA